MLNQFFDWIGHVLHPVAQQRGTAVEVQKACSTRRSSTGQLPILPSSRPHTAHHECFISACTSNFCPLPSSSPWKPRAPPVSPTGKIVAASLCGA
ncbi:hypothetical protein E2C01_011613 [Portunus trituberculatus]|uniref:Uncharacterized protein n=1 Tax=Portunus trituberculatus TaxID=210409 RepID=A0A5B7DBV7_PORTR|nr:hypothetical protein [Portunus trituberculatus]